MDTKITMTFNKFLACVRDGSDVLFRIHGGRPVKVPAQKIKVTLPAGITDYMEIHNEIILEGKDE